MSGTGATSSAGGAVVWDLEQQFDNELGSILSHRPPVAAAKVRAITKLALKSTKYYKHVVHRVERFIPKTPIEHRISMLYVMDSICRNSLMKYDDKDLYVGRFSINIRTTLATICQCPQRDLESVKKVLGIWKKGSTFPAEILSDLETLLEKKKSEFSPPLNTGSTNTSITSISTPSTPPFSASITVPPPNSNSPPKQSQPQWSPPQNSSTVNPYPSPPMQVQPQTQYPINTSTPATPPFTPQTVQPYKKSTDPRLRNSTIQGPPPTQLQPYMQDQPKSQGLTDFQQNPSQLPQPQFPQDQQFQSDQLRQDWPNVWNGQGQPQQTLPYPQTDTQQVQQPQQQTQLQDQQVPSQPPIPQIPQLPPVPQEQLQATVPQFPYQVNPAQPQTPQPPFTGQAPYPWLPPQYPQPGYNPYYPMGPQGGVPPPYPGQYPPVPQSVQPPNIPTTTPTPTPAAADTKPATTEKLKVDTFDFDYSDDEDEDVDDEERMRRLEKRVKEEERIANNATKPSATPAPQPTPQQTPPQQIPAQQTATPAAPVPVPAPTNSFPPPPGMPTYPFQGQWPQYYPGASGQPAYPYYSGESVPGNQPSYQSPAQQPPAQPPWASTEASTAITSGNVPPGYMRVKSTILWVGNVPPGVTKQQLHDLFSRFGKIVGPVKLMEDKKMSFISFETREQAEKAKMEMHLFPIEQNVKIKVGWGRGSVIKENFDWATGVSIVPLGSNIPGFVPVEGNADMSMMPSQPPPQMPMQMQQQQVQPQGSNAPNQIPNMTSNMSSNPSQSTLSGPNSLLPLPSSTTSNPRGSMTPSNQGYNYGNPPRPTLSLQSQAHQVTSPTETSDTAAAILYAQNQRTSQQTPPYSQKLSQVPKRLSESPQRQQSPQKKPGGIMDKTLLQQQQQAQQHLLQVQTGWSFGSLGRKTLSSTSSTSRKSKSRSRSRGREQRTPGIPAGAEVTAGQEQLERESSVEAGAEVEAGVEEGKHQQNPVTPDSTNQTPPHPLSHPHPPPPAVAPSTAPSATPAPTPVTQVETGAEAGAEAEAPAEEDQEREEAKARVWAMEYSHTTPFLTDHLDTSFTIGVLVQPVVGALSDKFQTRKPFVAIGAVLTCCASMTFSTSDLISGGINNGAIAIALISFLVMDLSINATMVSLRLLTSDMVSSSGDVTQQATAQTIASIFQATGQISGMLINGVFPNPLEQLWVPYAIASGSLLVSCGVCMMAAKETDKEDSPQEPHQPHQNCTTSLVNFARWLKLMGQELAAPPWMMGRVLAVQIFTWLSWFCSLIVLTSWFSEVFFEGDGDEGDNAGSMAFLAQAVVQLGASLLLSALMRWEQGRQEKKPPQPESTCQLSLTHIGWCITLLPLPVCCGLMFGLSAAEKLPVWGAQLLWGFTGIATAGTNIFPFAVVGQLYPSKNKGFMMGFLNLAIVIPQLIDTLYIGSVQEGFSINACIFLTAMWGLLAVLMCTLVRVPQKTQQSDVETPQTNLLPSGH
ncbi:splicing factor, arginine/serine-rich 15 [Pelomyxa schiedti]|nr:splicing factor, arginine/serine-rich 15 [Pelomyxa schiedti]